TGTTALYFDCTSDGSWESTPSTLNSTYTAYDVCNYPSVGTYGLRIRADRDGNTVQVVRSVVVQAGGSTTPNVTSTALSLDGAVSPAVGTAPLNGVDVTAMIAGTITSSVTYRFDCTSDGTWDHTQSVFSTTHTAYDICNYPTAGTYAVRINAEHAGNTVQISETVVVQQGTTFIPAPTSGSLTLDGSVTPSTSTAPLYNADVMAIVGGSATGTITYYFDCTSDGSWERIVPSDSTSYTAYDICNYPSAGSYAVRIRADRGGNTVQVTRAVLVTNTTAVVTDPTLGVTLTAQPDSGEEPLYNVDLRAQVSGTATGSITWHFDCTNDGSWEHIVTNNNETYTANNLCDYQNEGTYTARVRADRQGQTAYATDQVYVTDNDNNDRTLRVTLTATPNEGYIPLRNVDLIAQVTGTASGTITYYFDCTNDGSWDHTYSTSSTTYTAQDACDYTSVNLYTARVRADRQGQTAYDTDQITTVTTTVVQPAISGKGPLPATGVSPAFLALWFSAVSSL
ncbi:MAG: hypothetical protein WDZ44_00130, partial [Candidatus Spechtbacterales bacterium]